MAEGQGISSLTVREIYNNAGGVSYNYLIHRLTLWVRWRYLKRYQTSWGYSYTLAKRGIHFIEDIVPGPVLSRAFEAVGHSSN